ncbi:hypothetical protein ACHAWF_017734 [Thalassiosira exigua]
MRRPAGFRGLPWAAPPRAPTPSASPSAAAASRKSSRPPPPPPSPSILRHPLRWYASALDARPLATKCVTSGLIAGSGDLLCQSLRPEDGCADDDAADGRGTEAGGGGGGGGAISAEAEEGRPKLRQRPPLDPARTARFVVLGALLVAPAVHKWYGFLMARFPGTGARAVAKRVACDQGLFAPVFLPTFISSLTVLEHASGDGGKGGLPARLGTRLRDDVPDALVANWAVWIPSMGVMFAFVPGKYQVLFSNCIGFFWNAYLSWRTHEGEEAREEGDRD